MRSMVDWIINERSDQIRVAASLGLTLFAEEAKDKVGPEC